MKSKRGSSHAAHAAKAYAMESRSITKMPYKENNSLLVMMYFMSRSALEINQFSTNFFVLFLLSIQVNACRNTDKKCYKWRKFCGNNAYVKKNCLRTCGKCVQEGKVKATFFRFTIYTQHLGCKTFQQYCEILITVATCVASHFTLIYLSRFFITL